VDRGLVESNIFMENRKTLERSLLPSQITPGTLRRQRALSLRSVALCYFDSFEWYTLTTLTLKHHSLRGTLSRAPLYDPPSACTTPSLIDGNGPGPEGIDRWTIASACAEEELVTALLASGASATTKALEPRPALFLSGAGTSR